MPRKNFGRNIDFSALVPRQAWRWVAVALLLTFLALMVVMGFGGVTEVQDNEVAVIVNYVTGSMTVDPVPGNKIYMPFVQEIFTLDKSPNKFLMEGSADVSTDHVRELTVRASDGSNFWFDSLEIQYQLLPGEAARVINDSGVGAAFKRFWLMSYARSILRDEFGKFDPEGISDPSSYAAAKAEAQRKLNEVLRPHGIEIVQITTPKPRFSPEYEKAIEDRKLADQEVERLKAQAIQLQQEKAKRLAQIESTKGQEFAELKGKLEAELTMAQTEKIKVEREADTYTIQQEGEGEAERLAKTEEARGLLEKYKKEAEGLLAKAEALAEQGRLSVVEALAEKLADVQVTLVPYQRSPAPGRLEITTESGAPQEAGLLPATTSVRSTTRSEGR